jgi:hypothetical protein
MVEHALATQARIWGGNQNLVVPLGWDIGNEELFWRLIDRCDPDVIALHSPTLADVEEIAPDLYTEQVQGIERGLREAEFDDPNTHAEQIARSREAPVWQPELSQELRSKLVERVAPLYLDTAEPRTVHLDGSGSPPYPLTDLAKLQELPAGVLDMTSTLGDVDRLILTHAVGRLLPSFKAALEQRGVGSNPVGVDKEAILLSTAWPPYTVVSEFGYPRLLSDLGLARRLAFADRDNVIVVVGDDRRDFFLFHALSRMRPHVSWLPASRLDNEAYVNAIAEAARFATRATGVQRVHVTTASDDDAATRAVDLLAQRGRQMPGPTLTDWRETIPLSPLWAADAQSERRLALLRHEGETQELQTPIPISVSPTEDDFSALRWMVDVEVQGWRPARHPTLGPSVFQGGLVTAHDCRASVLGPSYSGLGLLVQPFLGLEASTARPRLRPRAIVDQVADILRPLGWDIRLSDKGAYALQSALLFGGLSALASALRDKATRALLDAYLTPTTSNDPGKYLKDTRRRYLSLKDASGVVGDDADVPALIAQLYDSGVVVRGHILKCEYCRATSFYSLTEEQRFTCVRCRTAQKATRFSWLGTAEPEFHYALSEVVLQFLKNHGELPLLAVNDHFIIGREREREALDVAFELDLVSPDEQLREHDIVATWGAELWLGEATLGDRLENTNAAEAERVRRLAETAKALSARGVLFVTGADAFTPSTKARIHAAFANPPWPDVVFIEGFDPGPMAGE